MGKESQCTCRWDERTSSGKALLETDEILFRGDFRLVVPLKEIKSVRAVEGKLRIQSPLGTIALTLGAAAEKWADRILHPPRRVDKLGVKPGVRVCMVGLDDAKFKGELAEAAADVVAAKPSAACGLLFLAAETRPDLKKLRSVKAMIKPAGAVWVIYPKGVKVITEADVRTAGLEAGLVDVKVMKFSDRQTGLKFVVPVAQRRT